ncbi:MAG: hypothetical protein DWH81_01365 [Planctomycetota bacterium]|nr:MAG: hypothetical protein DWH81_01365 [Planctomycetota bacterium]
MDLRSSPATRPHSPAGAVIVCKTLPSALVRPEQKALFTLVSSSSQSELSIFGITIPDWFASAHDPPVA